MSRIQFLVLASALVLVSLVEGMRAEAQQDAGTNLIRMAQFCPQDAWQCPDGTWVSRVPPNCEFRACRTAYTPAPVSTPPPNAYATTRVNQRAGPGTQYPVVVTVPERAYVTIYSCLRNYAWCDVGYQNSRGWILATYLQAYDGRQYLPVVQWGPRVNLPVIEFDVSSYWPRYYRNQPFYSQISYYGQRPVGVTPSTFYRPLAPHGSWVWLRGQYVWVPARVDSHWRPYTEGRWVYTNRYGWYWVSDEPFGWATYHYGRWGYSNTIGWFWVPGTQWAPAWVTWRASDDYLGWAPLPPGQDDSFRLDVSIGRVPDYYWQVVPSSAFLSINIGREVIRDQRRVAPVLEQTRPLGNVTVVNNVVVNNVVNVQYVEQKTQERVVAYEVAATSDAGQSGQIEGQVLQVLTANTVAAIEPPASDTPPEVRPIEEVAAASETSGQAIGQPTTEELVVEPEPSQEAASPPEPGLVAPSTAVEPSVAPEAAPEPPLKLAPVIDTAPPPPLPPGPEGAPTIQTIPDIGATPTPDTAPPPPPPGLGEMPSVVPEPPAAFVPAPEVAPPPTLSLPQPDSPPTPAAEVPPPPPVEAPLSPEPSMPELAPQQPASACPEGTVPADDGSCAVMQ